MFLRNIPSIHKHSVIMTVVLSQPSCSLFVGAQANHCDKNNGYMCLILFWRLTFVNSIIHSLIFDIQDDVFVTFQLALVLEHTLVSMITIVHVCTVLLRFLDSGKSTLRLSMLEFCADASLRFYFHDFMREHALSCCKLVMKWSSLEYLNYHLVVSTELSNIFYWSYTILTCTALVWNYISNALFPKFHMFLCRCFQSIVNNFLKLSSKTNWIYTY